MKTKHLLTFILLLAAFVGKTQVGVKDFSFGYLGDSYTTFDSMDVSGRSIVLQPDGAIVMGGADSFQHAVLVRYTGSGELDTTFGAAGRVITPVSLIGTASSASLALQADGKIVWAGSFDGQLTLIRYQTNGALDSSFATNGILQAPAVGGWKLSPRKVLLLPGDLILVEASASDGVVLTQTRLIRFLPNGTPDASFGTNASVGIARDSSHVFPRSLVLQADGKILVAARASLQSTAMPDYDYATLRLNPDGSLDSTYGSSGWVFTDFGFATEDPNDLILQTDGKIIVSGTSAPDSANQICLARYNTDGSTDSTFNGNGKVLTYYRNNRDRPSGIHFRTDSTLLVGGGTFTSTSSYYASVQVTNQGRNFGYGGYGIAIGNMPGTDGGVYATAVQPDDKLLLAGDAMLNGHRIMTITRIEAEPFVLDFSDGGDSLYPHNKQLTAVYLDRNGNGVRDSTESNFTEGKVVSTPQSNGISISFPTILNPSVLGIYTKSYIFFDSIWTTKIVPSKPYYHVTPDSSNAAVDYFHKIHVDTFAVTMIPGIRDAAITISPTRWVARPDTTTAIQIIYSNVGTDTIMNGIVKFAKDPRLSFVNATQTPSSVTPDTLAWNFFNQIPSHSDTILVYLHVPLPPIVTLGEFTRYYATVSTEKTDSALQDNEDSSFQVISYSYDPNVKSEIHGGSISTTQVTAGEYLQYRIDFQNTGNDTAYTVQVKDVLDAGKLIPSTIEMTGSSHSAAMSLQGNIVVWTFNNINLPDSGSSEENSHGFITFRIKPNPALQPGDVIANSASIYFDKNERVITNTVGTTVTGSILPFKLLSFTAKQILSTLPIRKGQKDVFLQWATSNELNTKKYEVERSIDGRKFGKIGTVTAGNSSYSFTDNHPFATVISNPVGEESGVRYYRLKMLDKDGKFTYSPIRSLIINNSSLTITLFPNPAKDNLNVQIDSEKKSLLQALIFSADGKVLLSKSITAIEGSSLQSINISALPKGNYYLKISTNNGGIEEQVIKFEKL